MNEHAQVEKKDKYKDLTMEDMEKGINWVGRANTGEPKYQFCNRKMKGSSLHISKEDYNKLDQGKVIQFFNLKSRSMLMSIKVVDSPKKPTKSGWGASS